MRESTACPIFDGDGPGRITSSGGRGRMLRMLHTLVLGTAIGMAAAQELPMVDITLVQTDVDRYDVRVRPDGPFNGLFHSYLFTLRWSADATATGLDLDPTMDMEDISLYPLLSGTFVTSNGYKYGAYTAESIVSLSSVGQSWEGGEEVTIATVQVLGGIADLQIANDDWTHANNGDYYLSLNGYERQGEIYSTSTGLSAIGTAVDQALRCTMEGDRLKVDLVMGEARMLDYQLVDMRGRVIREGVFAVPEGRSTRTMDIGRPAAGTYAFQVRAEEWGQSTRVNIIH